MCARDVRDLGHNGPISELTNWPRVSNMCLIGWLTGGPCRQWWPARIWSRPASRMTSCKSTPWFLSGTFATTKREKYSTPFCTVQFICFYFFACHVAIICLRIPLNSNALGSNLCSKFLRHLIIVTSIFSFDLTWTCGHAGHVIHSN